jgi:hypothetical protein
MKIAIPTDDAININKTLESARSFVVFTIQFGEIIEEEFRHSPENEPEKVPDIFGLIADCTVLIMKSPEECKLDFSGQKELKVFTTGENIITKIIVGFLNEAHRKEANTYCCP